MEDDKMSEDFSKSSNETMEDENLPSTSTPAVPGSSGTIGSVSAAFKKVTDSVADSLQNLTIETKTKEKTLSTSDVRSRDDYAVPGSSLDFPAIGCLKYKIKRVNSLNRDDWLEKKESDTDQSTSASSKKSEEYLQDTDIEESMDVDTESGGPPELPIDDISSESGGPPELPSDDVSSESGGAPELPMDDVSSESRGSSELPTDDTNTARSLLEAGPSGSSRAKTLHGNPRGRGRRVIRGGVQRRTRARSTKRCPKLAVLYEQMVKELLGEMYEESGHTYDTEEEEDL